VYVRPRTEEIALTMRLPTVWKRWRSLGGMYSW
jgi:hypothetical protein